VADVYLMRMSHSYSERGWGNPNLDLFKDLLSGITVAYHSRSTNLYGVLDNDDYFDYYGGLSMAIEKVTGAAPDLNVLHYANPANSTIMSLQGFMTREMRTRYYNPEWIQGMMNEGYSGARTISNKFINYLWGWQVTNPNIVQDWMWQEVVDIYLNDKYELGVNTWLSTGNRGYSLIEITGTLLTTAHKNFWKADETTLQQVADTWAKAIIQHGVSCGSTGCGNHEMFKWAVDYINPDLLPSLNDIIMRATNRTVLTPEELAHLLPKEQPDMPQADSDTAQSQSQSQSESESESESESGMTGADTVPDLTPSDLTDTASSDSPGGAYLLPSAPVTAVSRVAQAGPAATPRNSIQPLKLNQEESQNNSLTKDETVSSQDKQSHTDTAGPDKKARAYEITKENAGDGTVPVMAYVFLALAFGVLFGAALLSYFKRKHEWD
jgi:cobalamin biosynthesis Mg chelatase CobN